MSSPGRIGVATRQYRCQKRQKPCDHCRERKLKCQTDGGGGHTQQRPCQRCAKNNMPCTYVGRPRRRTMPASVLGDDEAESHVRGASVGAEAADTLQLDLHNSPVHSEIPISTPLDYTHDTTTLPAPTAGLNTPTSSTYHTSARVATQLSQTMDCIPGHSALLLGASSESDPWLLRHCHFDGLGLRSVHRLYFRNAGGVPTADKIPVHFLVSDDKYLAHPLGGLRDAVEGARERLAQLVVPAYGVRLVRLFQKYVYPTLPVLPTSYMDIPEDTTSPSPLDAIPVPVLAAMYALAMPFALNDELLAVVNAFESPPLPQLWSMVYGLIQAEIHRPSLSTIQAALLFMHKDAGTSDGSDLSSSSFLWSFIGSTVGMAHSLGLQLECRMFGVPTADKRLRRRLWWALYVEEKWQSLLMGRPPYIRADEWDVGELCDGDFERGYFGDGADARFAPFRDMARLAVIAADVQEKLYSLRACQRLAEDLAASISTAKPLFDQLNAWRSSIHAPEPFPSNLSSNTPSQETSSSTYPTTMYFAYLTLVTYIWRALLRPTVRSSPPPRIISVEDDDPPHDAGGFFFEDISWDFSDLPEIELHLDDSIPSMTADGEASSATIKELHAAAQVYASTVATFTTRLTSLQFDSFWYSWSRISFAVLSNFLTLLLVQAPSAEGARRARWMLEGWRDTLRHQSRAFPILRLAMARLNAFYWGGGLGETFCLPPHVQDVVAS